MPNDVLDLRLFRYALASAELGSFRRAAAALNIQQSTVSRGVRNLEHRIGAELFERDHSGVRPTVAGDRFLEEATLGFDHLRRATESGIMDERMAMIVDWQRGGVSKTELGWRAWRSEGSQLRAPSPPERDAR